MCGCLTAKLLTTSRRGGPMEQVKWSGLQLCQLLCICVQAVAATHSTVTLKVTCVHHCGRGDLHSLHPYDVD